MFLGLLDPDRVHQSDVWIRIRILLSPSKKVRKTLIPIALRLLFDFLSLKMMYKYLQKVISKKLFKKFVFDGILGWVSDENGRIRIRIRIQIH
jgi:hypothetical protein